MRRRPPPRSQHPLRTAGVVAGVALGVVLTAGCGSSHHAAAPTTTTVPVGVIPGASTTAPATTTTTAPVPAGAQADYQQDATDLIDAWVGGDRSAALAVATSSAVATLFATPYAGQRVELRGCDVNPPTPVCSYGPQGGASSSLALYELAMTQSPGGKWYVSGVDVEG